jgi:hypothetical protein
VDRISPPPAELEKVSVMLAVLPPPAVGLKAVKTGTVGAAPEDV